MTLSSGFAPADSNLLPVAEYDPHIAICGGLTLQDIRCILWSLLTLAYVALTASTVAGQEIDTDRPRTDPISQAALIPWKGDFATPADLGIPFDEVYFENSFGHRLRGWLIGREDSQQTILFCMGNTGNISVMLPYAQILFDAGYEVLLFDYQGFGDSEGVASISSLVDDCDAAFRFLTESRHRQPHEIGIFGVSLGSVLAMTLAAEQPLGAVAVEDAWVPQDEVEKFAARRFGNSDNMALRLTMQTLKALLLERVNPLQNVKRLKCPLLMIHGVNDRLLPATGTIKISEACPGPLRVYLIPNAGHAPETLEVHDLEYAHQLSQFFKDAFARRVKRLQINQRVTAAGTFAEVLEPSNLKMDECWQLCCRTQRGYKFQFSETPVWLLPNVLNKTQSYFAIKVKFGGTRQTNFQPQLSEYSKSLSEFRKIANGIFGSEFTAENMLGFEGRGFDLHKKIRGNFKLNQTAIRRLLENLPDPTALPPRIGPRYAKLLSRLHCWNQNPNDVNSSFAAEAMLRFLPENGDHYYELGNARIQLQFRDSVVTDVLYQLAKLRLRSGKVDDAKALMMQHLNFLPPHVPTSWTSERVQQIQQESDLARSFIQNPSNID